MCFRWLPNEGYAVTRRLDLRTLAPACTRSLETIGREYNSDMSIKEIGRLLGTWRLVSYEARDSTGQLQYPLGKHVTGQLIYDADGNMSAHLMRNDRPAFASKDFAQGTDTEVRTAFEGYLGYFGTYTIDATKGIVTHYVGGASYPNAVDSEQIRYYKFDGKHLTL